MFTGIIEETGKVESIQPREDAIRLTLTIRKTGAGLKVGDSLAVNGCCLTVVKIASKGRAKVVQFDLLNETWNLTNLQFCRAGSLVNLERSLKAGGRLSGHFVTGHIDGMGKIIAWEQVGDDRQLQITAPENVMRYVIHKGSIALDGISLTVAKVEKVSFTIWIIPHTFDVTALKERALGAAVNLEADMIGKYVERFTAN
jgi:riboflavin synthase|tara:strand:- start:4298 stop:4897 length:600 start_codon:yes stop_codon:yes gene_type:complete